MANIYRSKKIKIRFTSRLASLVLMLSLSGLGCTKFVQIDPPVTEIAGASVYSSNGSAAAVMSGVYSNMSALINGLTNGRLSIGLVGGISADELKNYNNSIAQVSQYYSNTLTSQNNFFWSEIYNEIQVVNSVIEGLSTSAGVTPGMKQQLNGEAKFMRAFLLFYAVNLFGDVPLVTTTDYLVNNSIKRSPSNQVYEQIIADLKDAQSNLSANFLDQGNNVTTERTRPNKGAATSLLSRVYLYASKWDSAEVQASAIINNSGMYSLDSLNDVFLANSSEAVLQFQPVSPGYNTYDAFSLVLLSVPGNARFPYALSSSLRNAFEPGDERRTNWVDSITVGANTYYYPYKYKVGVQFQPLTEYVMVLRLAEQYLIRAEAEANGAGAGISAAVTDLNIIRNRAGLPNYSGATDQNSVLTAIYHERQVELFTEWAHRWLDLKRTNNIDAVMNLTTPLKGGVWSSYKSLFPIPESEILLNQNLTQNPGYN